MCILCGKYCKYMDLCSIIKLDLAIRKLGYQNNTYMHESGRLSDDIDYSYKCVYAKG